MTALGRFIREARRRRVFRVAGYYVVAAWVAVQVASEALPALDIAAGSIRYVWLAALLGFPLALVFGWLYDVTPTGLRRTPPAKVAGDTDLSLRRADFLLLGALGLVAVAIVSQLLGRMDAPAIVEEPADPMSIAVLPLENLSGDPEQAFFVAGMQDALISALSRVSGFRVTSRTSTLAFADAAQAVDEIARSLGVSKIVEGSVYRVGNTVRIIVQLIDADTDTHLWEAEYEREVRNVLRLQSDITRAIADEIQVTLTQAESRGLASTSAVDPEAYTAFLNGNFHAERFTPQDMRQAVEFYTRAAEIEPGSALPYYGLSRICRFQLQAGLVPPREGEPRCREPLIRALEIDDSVPEVHLGLALGFWLYDFNWPAAEQSFKRALELKPSFAEARMFYSHFLAHMRRQEESTQQILKARELDPLNVFVKSLHAAQQMLVGDSASAVDLLEECLRESPNLGFGYDVLWFANARLGRQEDAIEAARRHFGITMNQPTVAAAIANAGADGAFAAVMRAGAEAAERVSIDGYLPPVEIAALWGMAGDVDKAFEWLERGYDRHDPKMPYLSTAVFLGDARQDPRYEELLRRMKLDMWLE